MPTLVKAVFICLCSLTWLLGCTGHAILKPVEDQNSNITVDNLVQNRTDYHIYFIVVHGNTGNTALLFDPKDDDNALITKSWMPVEDEATLTGKLQMMEGRNYNRFSMILGRESQLFGYLLAARSYISARQVDANTMEVYSFRQQNTGP